MLTIDEYQARAQKEFEDAKSRYYELDAQIKTLVAESNEVSAMIRAIRATMETK